MQLTRYTDYALRTVIYLGVVKRSATISEIAERYGISRNHLVKVVHHLGRIGYLETTRGKSGGLKLALPPAEINLGSFVRDLEPNFDIVECFNAATDTCPITPACRLKNILGEALEAFLSVLNSYTLADLIEKEDSELINQLLGRPIELGAAPAHR
jgi:Rrf2 family nitric oxide-sensitive transcriptional repressor